MGILYCKYYAIIETLDRTVGGKRHSVVVEISLTPLELNQNENASVEVSLDVNRESIKAPGYSREEVLSAIKSGVESACLQGTVGNRMSKRVL